MSRKDYEKLAVIMGNGLAISAIAGSGTDQAEAFRTEFYNECYTPLVLELQADNPRFDMTRFSYATGKAETTYLVLAKAAGR